MHHCIYYHATPRLCLILIYDAGQLFRPVLSGLKRVMTQNQDVQFPIPPAPPEAPVPVIPPVLDAPPPLEVYMFVFFAFSFYLH